MAVAYDATGSGANSTTTSTPSLSWSHTAAGGANNVVVVFVGFGPDIPANVTMSSSADALTSPSCTYGGTAMQYLGTLAVGSPYVFTAVFVIRNPASGSQTVAFSATVNSATTPMLWSANSVSYTGAGLPSISGLTSGAVNPITATAPASSGTDMIVAAVVPDGPATSFTSPSGTVRWNNTTQVPMYIQDTPGTGAAVTLSVNQNQHHANANVIVTVPASDEVYIDSLTTIQRVTGASAPGAFALQPTASDVNTVLIVAVEASISSTGTYTPSVTYGGTSMTLWDSNLSASANGYYVGLFYLYNPGTSSQNITVTNAGTATITATAAQGVVYRNAATTLGSTFKFNSGGLGVSGSAAAAVAQSRVFLASASNGTPFSLAFLLNPNVAGGSLLGTAFSSVSGFGDGALFAEQPGVPTGTGFSVSTGINFLYMAGVVPTSKAIFPAGPSPCTGHGVLSATAVATQFTLGVAYDATGAGNPVHIVSPSGSASETHIIGAGATAIVAAVYVFNDSITLPTVTATAGGTPMTLLGSLTNFFNTSGFYGSLYLFGLPFPPTGSQSIVANLTGGASNTYLNINSVSYKGGVTTFGTVATNSGNSASPALTVSAAISQMVFQAFGGYSTNLASYNQTQRYSIGFSAGSQVAFLIGDAPGAASTSFTCSEASNFWGAIGVPLLPTGVLSGHGALSSGNNRAQLSGHGALTATAVATKFTIGVATYDATGVGQAIANATLSWSHTLAANATAIVAAVDTFSTNTSGTIAASVGGRSMTLLGSVLNYASGGGYLYLFGLLYPPTGAQTISVTGASADSVGNSVSYTGVTGFGTIATNSGSSATPTLSVSSVIGQMVAQAFGGYTTTLASYNKTQRYNAAFAGGVNLAFLMGDAPGAGTVSFTCSEASDKWAAVGVPLVPTRLLTGNGALSATAVATKFTFTKAITGHGVLSATAGQLEKLTGHGQLSATITPSSSTTVQYDAAGAGIQTTSTLGTFAHTVNGSALVVGVYLESQGSAQGASVTVGGVPLVQLSSESNFWEDVPSTTYGSIFVFGLINPPQGAQTISVSTTGMSGSTFLDAQSVSYKHVGGFGTATLATANNTSPSDTTSTGDRVVNVFGAWQSATTTTFSSYNGVSRVNTTYNTNGFLLGDRYQGAATVSVVGTSPYWAAFGIPLNATTSSGVGTLLGTIKPKLAVALTGNGVLTPTPSGAKGVGAFSGHGVLSATAKPNLAAVLTGHGVLITTPSGANAAGAFSGHGTLSVADKPTLAAVLTGHGVLSVTAGQLEKLTGHGVLSATAAATKFVLSVAITGHGVLNPVPCGAKGAGVFSGHGVLSATASADEFKINAALPGHGVLIATTKQIFKVSPGLLGPGALSTSARMYSINETPMLSGNGVLSAATYAKFAISPVLTGHGAFSAVAHATKFVLTCQITGNGVLGAIAESYLNRIVIIPGTGSLTVSARASLFYEVSVLSGHGALTATTMTKFFIPGQLPGQGHFSATAYIYKIYLTQGLTDSGRLTGTGYAKFFRSSPVVGHAVLTGAAFATRFVLSEPLKGRGVFSALARGFPSGVGHLQSAGVLTATARMSRSSAAPTLTSHGNLVAIAKAKFLRPVALVSHGGLTATAVAEEFRVAPALHGHGGLTATTSASEGLSAQLTGRGVLAGTANIVKIEIIGAPGATGQISASAYPKFFSPLRISGNGALSATIFPLQLLKPALSGNGTASAVVQIQKVRSAALISSGVLMATAERSGKSSQFFAMF